MKAFGTFVAACAQSYLTGFFIGAGAITAIVIAQKLYEFKI